jgi:hypothetical protein
MQYIKLISFLSIGLFSVLSLGSCVDNPEELLIKSIKSALKDNQGISVVEFAEIKALIQNNSELSQTFNTDEAIKAFILATADEMCKSSRSKINCPVTIECCSNAVSTTNNKLIFDFFYENSASMDGYISSKSNFSDAVLGMITQAKLKEHKVNMYYVNNGVYPLNDKMESFEGFLKPENTRNYGQRGNSEINKILSIAVDSALTKPERATVLISDYIYSMKGKKVVEELDVLKNTTALTINKLAKKDYATLIIKINSKFTGTFYTSTNASVAMTAEDRPVYLWIFCHKSLMSKVVNDFKITQLNGYDKHLVLMTDNSMPNVYYSGLTHTNKEGRFEKQDRSTVEIKNLKNIESNRDGKFSMGIAVDLSVLPVMEADKLNPINYEVVSTANNAFSIEKIEDIKVAEHNDKKLVGAATHILTLSLNEKPKSGNQDLKINFKKQIPTWVKDCSTQNDNDPNGRTNKTFGLEALIKGAAQAYDYNEKSTYFSLPININN